MSTISPGPPMIRLSSSLFCQYSPQMSPVEKLLFFSSRIMSPSASVGYMLVPDTCSTGRKIVAVSTATAATTSSA